MTPEANMSNQQLAQELALAVDQMPAFPKSVQRILEMTQDGRCSPKDVVLVIDKDPVLTVKILKMVNSAYFRLPKRINSIGHAVVYLGFNATKNLALAMASIGMLPRGTTDGFDWHAYLLHSLTTAGIAKQLAARVDDTDALDCFVAGLLHDFGKVVLARFKPAQFHEALALCRSNNSSLHLALRQVLGVDHASIAAMLVEKWRFAPALVEAVGNQYGDDPKDTGIVACVYAANQISKKMSWGFAGNPFVAELPACVAQRLGGNLEEVMLSLGDLGPMFEEAKRFASV